MTNRIEILFEGRSGFVSAGYLDTNRVLIPILKVYSGNGKKFVAIKLDKSMMTIDGLSTFLKEIKKRFQEYETKTKVHKKVRRA